MSWLRSSAFRAGALVEVRSAEEIAATLDAEGTLDRLPFMPEMLPYCGRRFRVSKRAHKTCDTVRKTGGRRMDRTVHLEGLRCDGGAHGGCQAACLLFWKDAWLRPVREGKAERSEPAAAPAELAARLAGATRRSAEGETLYRCQATDLFEATRPIRRFDPTHYLEDLASGNVRLGEFVRVVMIALFNFLQGLRGGGGFPRFPGGTLEGRTPSRRLDLQPGEEVEVRSAGEIAATLDTEGRNRGMWFDHEMVPSCGERHRVAWRVERFIEESTGRLVELRNDSVVLEGVVCRAHFSKGRLFCPRSITPWWREIWLRRVGEGAGRGNPSE